MIVTQNRFVGLGILSVPQNSTSNDRGSEAKVGLLICKMNTVKQHTKSELDMSAWYMARSRRRKTGWEDPAKP